MCKQLRELAAVQSPLMNKKGMGSKSRKEESSVTVLNSVEDGIHGMGSVGSPSPWMAETGEGPGSWGDGFFSKGPALPGQGPTANIQSLL